MKRAPKIYRRKKAGKFVGNFFVDVKGVSVNLGTKDAPLATRRRVDALKGLRVFEEDVDAAAAGVVEAVAPKPHPLETMAPAAPVSEAPPQSEAPPALSIVPPLPPAPPPVEDIPGGPPPEGWADAMEAAATETAGEQGPEGEPERAAAKEEFAVTMDDVMRVLKMPAGELAPAVVEVQIKLTEQVAEMRGKVLAPIPPDHVGRGLATAAYEPIIKALQADKIKINPLYLLLAGTGLMLVTQLRGMQDKPKAPSVAAAA